MMSETWLSMTAADLGRGIAAGQIDPVALTDAFLAAAAGHPDTDRIYARLTPERARLSAAAAVERAAVGRRLGPLDGVPVSWKDLFDTAGVGTESGSRLLAGRIPARDARVVETAEAAGLVCLGKTHMTELAFAGLGLNPMTATPPCVNDPGAVPGGSSSGAAASVAFGLAAAAVGSDTGGSVRVPSAWNDLVGLKTTSGLLPLEGVVPLCESFDTIGPLTRTVEDAALMLGALTGHAAPDLRGSRLAGTRLAVLQTLALEDLHPTQAAAFEGACAALERAGARVEPIGVAGIGRAMDLAGILYTTEAYATWEAVIEAAPEKMYDRVRDRFRVGGTHKGTDFVRAWVELRRLRQQYLTATAGFDAVLLPTTQNMPPQAAAVAADAGLYVRENLACLRNTRIGNLMGLCALNLPTGIPSCGLMVMAAPFNEARLLRLGVAIEEALSRD